MCARKKLPAVYRGLSVVSIVFGDRGEVMELNKAWNLLNCLEICLFSPRYHALVAFMKYFFALEIILFFLIIAYIKQAKELFSNLVP